MRRQATEAIPDGSNYGDRPKKVVGQTVDRAIQLGLNSVHDHGRIRRDSSSVIRYE